MEAATGFHAVLAGARGGDEWALTALYRSLHAKLLRYLAAHEPNDADDIASDVWMDIARGLNEFEGDEPAFRAWSFTIARRRLADFRRRLGREQRRLVPFDTVRDRRNDVDVPELAATDIAIRAALSRLSALSYDDAEVILLRVVGGFSAEEVGELVGAPAATVRTRQQRAIQRLAQGRTAEVAA